MITTTRALRETNPMSMTDNDEMTVERVQALLAKERREARAAAKAFVAACAGDDPDALTDAVDLIETTVSDWRGAMYGVGKLPTVHSAIQEAFLPIWVQYKMLPLHVGSRMVLARALRKLLPGQYEGPPLRLFRGASGRERKTRAYGFSWTTRQDMARQFAEHWRRAAHGGVVFETTATAHAVLLIREEGASYDEGEVVLDPFALSRVRTIDILSAETRHGPLGSASGPVHGSPAG
ncbi:MAG: hypothetical protein M3Z35_11140 [Nitrospirota bacterium]|nr:hypothetical protein [Nitrospirota bacterium]